MLFEVQQEKNTSTKTNRKREITFEIGDGIVIGDGESQVSIEVCIDEDDGAGVRNRRPHLATAYAKPYFKLRIRVHIYTRVYGLVTPLYLMPCPSLAAQL